MTQQQEFDLPQFQPPPPLPPFGSPPGAHVRFMSFEFVMFLAFRLILMFFKWFRFSILHRSVIHGRASSTARRDVAAAIPTSQTTISLYMFSYILWIVPSLVLLNCVCVAKYYLLLYMMICSWGGVIFRIFFNMLIVRRPTIAKGRTWWLSFIGRS
jgi:hypothetical protein